MVFSAKFQCFIDFSFLLILLFKGPIWAPQYLEFHILSINHSRTNNYGCGSSLKHKLWKNPVRLYNSQCRFHFNKQILKANTTKTRCGIHEYLHHPSWEEQTNQVSINIWHMFLNMYLIPLDRLHIYTASLHYMIQYIQNGKLINVW